MRTSGVGVGLFIARRLAMAMDGSVHLESQLGIGSTFALRLPRSLHHPDPPRDTDAANELTESRTQKA
jgi:signal transduction histidine kinase